MKVETSVGVLLIISLSLALWFGVSQEYDGKNLRALAGMHLEMKERAISAERAATAALEQARADRERLELYIDYIVGQVEAP